MIPPDVLKRARAVLAAHGGTFAQLSDAAGFDRARHWNGANLRDVDFGTDDLTGFRFRNADLSGADLSRARGLTKAMLKGATGDARTLWPRGRAEPWAEDWGADQYGAWASFSVTARGGKRVAQRMRWIPPGTFLMGSPDDEPGRYDHEGPRHPVTLDGFWLFATPCTQALWRAVMGNNPSRFKSAERPVERVSFNDVRGFIDKINAMKPGLRLRLPSEAQWEYACRAGTNTAIHTGDLAILGENNAPALDPIAWHGGNSGKAFDLRNGYDSSDWPEKQYDHKTAGTRPVARKHPNPWGLFDMLGNVWEWCEDSWHENYNGAPTDGSAWLEPDARAGGSAGRVVRGGSWFGGARRVRAAYRNRRDPVGRLNYLGFRCARIQSDSEAMAGAKGGEELRKGAERPDGDDQPVAHAEPGGGGKRPGRRKRG